MEEYITKEQNAEIIQRLIDIYGQDYLLGNEWAEAYKQLADDYIYNDIDELYIYNNTFDD